MGKVVSLTVHKNKLEQRKRKELRIALKDSVKNIPIDYDSWVVIAFKREPDELKHHVDYVIEDAALLPLLSKMVQHLIESQVIRDMNIDEEEDNG